MVGLETYDTDEPAPLAWAERQELRRQGYLTSAQMDIVGQHMRRGIVEI